MSDHQRLSAAREDYLSARRTAILRGIWSSLTGTSNDLIPFEDLKKALGSAGQHYRGLQPVPLEKIIGSMGRSDDFDRAFLPTQSQTRGKWVSVDSAVREGVTLPPVSLYKVGDAYFVVDGHHRVSVARRRGQKFIDAEIIEVQSRVPVRADLTYQDLDVLAAYRDFLDETKLDQLRPDQDLLLTMPGDYRKLIDHIHVHKYFVDREQGRTMSWEEAVTHWYDYVYMPVVRAIRRHHLLDDFPERTEADLYLWIIEHAYYLSQELGQNVRPWEVAKEFARRFSRRPGRLWSRVKERLIHWLVPQELEPGPPPGTWRTERLEPPIEEPLFRDILVTLTGAETGWRALSQAAEIARREKSVLHGIHVLTPERSEDEEAVAFGRQVLQEFTARCQSWGLESTTSLVVGDVAQRILERARWVDLVVINQRREHGRLAERPLGTIFQTVASQTARPVLAVPGGPTSTLQCLVLAYDGSPKAREALFVFRHLLCKWHGKGIILTVGEGEETASDREMLDLAWQYIQECGATDVITRYERGVAADVIPRVMGEERADMLLMGGFGHQPLLKAFLGSTVDQVLRVAWFPVLICR
ncbi:MAG: universal stress protein [Chloroflexi bacterium]|nr:universal stress protein [Chloroflexota bacterium]